MKLIYLIELDAIIETAQNITLDETYTVEIAGLKLGVGICIGDL